MTTKLCTKCETTKDTSQFSKNKAHKDGLATMCKECWNKYYKAYYASGKERERLAKNNKVNMEAVRDFVKEAKSVPCADCGEQYPSYVMDFDHLPEYEKLFTIAQKSRYTLKKVKEEVKKCEVVCSNCHRIRTHNRRSPVV